MSPSDAILYTPVLPEIFVLSMACVILLVDVYLKDEHREFTYTLCQWTLLGAVLITSMTLSSTPTITFYGHVVKDAMGDVLKLGIYLSTALVFLYSREYLQARSLFKGEYYILGLFAVLGMMVMVSAHSLLSLYLGLELFSLSTYTLVAFHRDSSSAAEAGIKYFVLGALASGMLLYGISMMYGATGSLEISEISNTISQRGSDDLVLVFGVVFLVVGIAFKFGAVPFHMWIPDVYEGAPTSVALFIGAAPKLAAFAMTIRLLANGLESLHADWQQMLVILALLSMGTGNLLAIAQSNIKRMLAYSTISHVGFLLLGILAGTESGYAASMFYALTYVLMVTAAFGMILVLSRAGVEIEDIRDFRGLNENDSWLAFLMLLTMMSMAGIPFLVGFYAKLVVLQAAVSAGLVWLAIYGVIFSVIGAFYYLRVVKVMYFDKPERSTTVDLPSDLKYAISANGLLILVLGLFPSILMSLCEKAFQLGL